MEILNERESHVKSIMDDVKKEMSKIRSDKGRYKDILKKLILQALYQVVH